MPAIKTYDPSKVNVWVAGLLITGFMQGRMLSHVPGTETISSDSGCDGEPARWMNRDPFSTLYLSLAHTASSNGILSNLHNLDLVTQAGITPVYVEDASNAKAQNHPQIIAGRAWVVSHPEIIYEGGTPSGRRWAIKMVDAINNTQGIGASSTITI